MKMKTERHLFSKLPDEQKQELVDEVVQWSLAVLHSNTGHPRTYWLDTKSYETILYLLRTEEGKLVGTTTLKLHRVHYEGNDIVVVKLGLGIDPQHRGNKFALRCLMSEMLRWKVTHPIQPLYLFSTLIHPVTYKLCCDLLGDRLYPYFKNPVNPEMRKMLEYLVELFDVEKADAPSPFVYKERFSAIETQEAVDYWRNSQRPEVRFFVEHCPGYHCSSDCLICLAPVDLTHILARMIGTLARNRLDRWRGRKPRFA